MPAATLVKVTGTEHLETVVDVPEGDNVQIAPTVPTAVLDDVKLTEPLGAAVAAGGLVVSVTVAVQLVAPPGTIVMGGPQATTVTVLSFTGALLKLAIDPGPRLSGTEPPVPPLVIVTQVFGKLVPVQAEPVT